MSKFEGNFFLFLKSKKLIFDWVSSTRGLPELCSIAENKDKRTKFNNFQERKTLFIIFLMLAQIKIFRVPL